MLHYLLTSYEAIDKIDLEEKSVKMMGTYDPAEPLSLLMKQLEKGRQFTQSGGQTLADAMMASKGITLMAQTAIFNENIREWQRQSTEQNTWENSRYSFTKTTVSKGKR